MRHRDGGTPQMNVSTQRQMPPQTLTDFVNSSNTRRFWAYSLVRTAGAQNPYTVEGANYF